MRSTEINRKTSETDIKLSLCLDRAADVIAPSIDTGCGFLDHMLTLFAKHGGFMLSVSCKGDTQVDYHHTVEDIGIALGRAFDEALGDRRGICRYGSMLLPMDEALVLSAVDISGRAFLCFDLDIPTEKVGDFDTELVREFWQAFVRCANITLHIKGISGSNSHHIIEAAFKSAARALKAAVAIDASAPDAIPSTKGVI